MREIARGRAPFILGEAQLFYEPGSFGFDMGRTHLYIIGLSDSLASLTRRYVLVRGCGCEKHGMWIGIFHLLYSGLC